MLTALLTSIVSSTLLATADHPELQLKKMIYAGRGCPLQGVSVVTSDEPNRFAFKLPEMSVEWGSDIPVSRSRSSCAINLDYVVPDGWQIAVSHVGMKAVANLAPEVEAVLSTRVYFSGQSNKMLKHEYLVKGPRNYEDIVVDNYTETPIWSACGGRQTLSLLWIARLNMSTSKAGSGFVEFFYDISEPVQSVDLIWQPCEIMAPESATFRPVLD